MTVPEWSNGHIVNGKYTIQSVLGRSGRSRTYAAIMEGNRELVLYVVGQDDQHALDPVVERLLGTHNLNDPSLLRTLDVGRDDASGARFVVTERSRHPSLATLVALCPLTVAEGVSFAHKLARAIGAAHTGGAAALELRPTTVFLGPMPDGAVHITTLPMPPVGVVSFDRMLWCAPEQLEKGALAGGAADVFTGALLVFYALTGKPYWTATTEGALRAEHKAPRPPLSKRAAELGVTLPKSVDVAFARALEIDPKKRPHELLALAAALGPPAPAASGVTVPQKSLAPAAQDEPAVIIADSVAEMRVAPVAKPEGAPTAKPPPMATPLASPATTPQPQAPPPLATPLASPAVVAPLVATPASKAPPVATPPANAPIVTPFVNPPPFALSPEVPTATPLGLGPLAVAPGPPPIIAPSIKVSTPTSVAPQIKVSTPTSVAAHGAPLAPPLVPAATSSAPVVPPAATSSAPVVPPAATSSAPVVPPALGSGPAVPAPGRVLTPTEMSARDLASAIGSGPETARTRKRMPVGLIVGGVAAVVVIVIGVGVALRHGKAGTTTTTSATVASSTSSAPSASSATPSTSAMIPAPVADAGATEPEDSGPPPMALGPNECELRVVCEPVNCAIVMVDRKKLTNYPDPGSVKVAPGKHGVGVNGGRNYWNDWQLVETKAGEHAVVVFKLKPRPPALIPTNKKR